MRDGDAAWRFRFIESSLGRCNGTRNASLLRVSPVSSPPARLFGLLLSRTRAHLPHAPHLHTHARTNVPRRPTGFHRAPNKHASTDDDDDDDNGTRIVAFREPPFFFLPFDSASTFRLFEPSIEPTPLPRAIYEAGHAEFLNYSQVPVKFVGGTRPFVRPTRGEPFFIILRRVHRNGPRFATVEE